ncbi:FecR family protein [Paenibacillus mendelii]|uniref:FecR domain-containing protein n=1 Tax=Paenibacillus mendelii TaxID=206163 RepID=A0ABV6JB51_9BACL|nr:FecR domain-containing protein [Paenibacillus mendelii]MCQ6563012.1 FecR domain-containing protein [Paenibacillus mendelii]
MGRRKSMKVLLLALCLALFAGPAALFAGSGKASAQVMRVAIVKSLKGTVNVMKSGGTKSFKAFKNMSLNEGDQIATGKDSSVQLELASDKADQDSVTIGANAQVTFSKLKDANSTKTKMNIWAGSLWLKVKSVSNAADQFEVETPTSIMGVRGTQFLVGVDPLTGMTSMTVFAGVVQTVVDRTHWNSPVTQRLQQQVPIMPTQQIILTPIDQGVRSSQGVIDIADLISSSSPEIIQQILMAAQSIREEQDQQLAKWKLELASGQLPGQNQPALQADLDRMQHNFEALLSLIAQQAIDAGKISKSEMDQIIDEVNKAAESKLIDLNKKQPLELSEQEKKKQKELQQMREEEKKKALEEQKKKEESRNKDLLDKLKKEQERIKEQNERILEEQRKKAEEAFKQALDYQAKQQFEDEQKKREQEKKDAQPPTQTPGVLWPGSGSGPGEVTPSTPSAKLAFGGGLNSGDVLTGEPFYTVDLEVKLDGFTGSSNVYGFEIELDYENAIFNQENEYRFNNFPEYTSVREDGPFKVEIEGNDNPLAESVDQLSPVWNENRSGGLKYSVLKFAGNGVATSGETTVLKLPFDIVPLNPETSESTTMDVNFKIRSIKAIDKQGNIINTIYSTNAIKLGVSTYPIPLV